MKAVLWRFCPDARLVDVTHLIEPGDVLAGSITLERAIDAFPAGTVHLVVVDPGVGSSRRILVAQVAGQWVVCPDNGLITWAWRRKGAGRTWELTWRPDQISSTFHGRDIMAPVAGMLAAGASVEQIARPINDPVLLDIAPALPPATVGQIIHIDRFGNCTTNIRAKILSAVHSTRISVKGRLVGPLRQTYSEVAAGEVLILIGSSGLLEIAVRDGSAARMLSLRVGDSIDLVQ